MSGRPPQRRHLWLAAVVVGNPYGVVCCGVRWHDYVAAYIGVADGHDCATPAGGAGVVALAVVDVASAAAADDAVSAETASRPSSDALPLSSVSTHACQCVLELCFALGLRPSDPLD